MEKGVLRNFAKFTGKHLCQSLFLNKVDLSLTGYAFYCMGWWLQNQIILMNAQSRTDANSKSSQEGS